MPDRACETIVAITEDSTSGTKLGIEKSEDHLLRDSTPAMGAFERRRDGAGRARGEQRPPRGDWAS